MKENPARGGVRYRWNGSDQYLGLGRNAGAAPRSLEEPPRSSDGLPQWVGGCGGRFPLASSSSIRRFNASISASFTVEDDEDENVLGAATAGAGGALG